MATISGLSQSFPGHVLGALLARRAARATQRHALARMDKHALADIGLTRIGVAVGLRKGFWQR